jgi:hypothetical protein
MESMRKRRTGNFAHLFFSQPDRREAAPFRNDKIVWAKSASSDDLSAWYLHPIG